MVLKKGDSCSTTAEETYEHYARLFKWDLDLKKYFLKQRVLYATNVDKKNNSCWCICHSNFTGTASTYWVNTFKDNGDTLEEEWKIPVDNDHATRIVFVKKKNLFNEYKYEFFGVYKSAYFDTKRHVKVYKRISTTYTND